MQGQSALIKHLRIAGEGSTDVAGDLAGGGIGAEVGTGDAQAGRHSFSFWWIFPFFDLCKKLTISYQISLF